ncbi:MAG: LptF/LptG family permease [Candidatus Omnitrophota bacterium]
MKILRNYFLKEFIGPLFLSLGALSFVMVLVGNLKRIADLVINRGIDILSVGKLFLFMMPYIVTYALPISVLVAVLMALGRLSSDNEITAIRASGIHFFSLLSPLMVMGVILSLFLVIFNDRAASYAHYAYRKTLMEIGIRRPAAAFEEGVFINSFRDYILFIYHVDQKKNKLGNIRIYQPQENGPTRTIIARSGEFITDPDKGTVKLKLMDGSSDEPDPNNPLNFYKLNFKTYFMSLNLSQAKDTDKLGKKPKDMSLQELRNEINKLNNEGIDTTPLLTEINEKMALAFSTLAFILLGSSLAVITRRREKSINIGLAVLVIGIYYPLFIGCEALAIEGVLPATLAMWIPNALFALIGILLTLKVCAY